MRLRIRTLSNEEAELDVGPEETIFNLKEKVEQKWPHMPAVRQKLVHAGKILADSQKVKECPSLKENDRLVVMVTKAVAQPAGASSSAAPAAPAPASSATASPSETPSGDSAAASSAGASAVSADASGSASAPAPSGTSEGEAGEALTRTAAESALFTGPQLEETLTHLVAMGFPRDQAEQAMRAAFNNPDRAVEYLMNGMPPEVSALFGGASGEAQDAEGDAIADEGDADGDEGDEDDGNPLGALRHHPAFNQIRQMVQANPAMLPQVLQLIGNSNPQLLELITQNQDAFLEMLQSGQGTGEAGAPGTGFGAGGIIQMTPDEMEALQRLEALGFSRHQAVEAYLACDRNEEMAANYLFENLNDLGDDAGD
ncbi:hypothetical protein NCLIV_002400 [Neospora caninum Liverpool]|uniref:UV excision repair protein RAD23 n=1 Tax=Neospora caninum (strain Liverpool) TaxID=572307 RepID=F0V7R2_NEOCL|nr:hypothetical protein NCLIV_002400 [Neospora caninum Liverpool]CBZ49753.1 hypothetical protein NCLIV_002400 [Neospora caninum Liverpool]CEL64338.1 TPA: DNA repair protein RAD23, related [Neospora caninum Liverpool]|eukprot:XP_003879788.1 hypothetical protein NCLIV_002400 [Neospora caninum Liverpool]